MPPVTDDSNLSDVALHYIVNDYIHAKMNRNKGLAEYIEGMRDGYGGWVKSYVIKDVFPAVINNWDTKNLFHNAMINSLDYRKLVESFNEWIPKVKTHFINKETLKNAEIHFRSLPIENQRNAIKNLLGNDLTKFHLAYWKSTGRFVVRLRRNHGFDEDTLKELSELPTINPIVIHYD